MVKRPEAAPAVVEHTIKDQAHATALQLHHQGIEGGIASEQRVHLQVVVSVVAVIGRRTEDRVEVESGDAELLQMIEPLDHAVEITPLKPHTIRRRAPGLQRQAPLLGHAATAAEAIGKDLAHHRIGHPGGRISQGPADIRTHNSSAPIHRVSHLCVQSSMAAPTPGDANISSVELARYLEQRGELSKPWMLQLLRLTKLKEERASMDPQEYMDKLQEAHADLMRLGEFWKGREQEVFGGRYQPSELLEPLPGSAEDR